MNYRDFGKTNLKVSEIGLGCSSLGGGLYYKNDRESVYTLLQALDSGINFYDVSDHNTQGAAERLIGQTFKDRRDQVIIASKAGFVFSGLGKFAFKMRPLVRPVSRLLRPFKSSLHSIRAKQLRRYDFSPQYLIQAVEKSLKRLQTDYLDLFQLYKPSLAIIEKGDFLEALEKLKLQGKIRYYGIACLTVQDAIACLEHSGISSVQVAINLIDREAVTKLLPLIREKRVALVARYPRAMSLFVDDHNDITADMSAYSQKEIEERKESAEMFRFLVREGRTMAQAAIRFVLQLDGVSVVLPRAVNRKQLEENLGSLHAPSLNNKEFDRIYSVDVLQTVAKS